jgi:DNA repair exonuclease SbcCD ATPase subunit
LWNTSGPMISLFMQLGKKYNNTHISLTNQGTNQIEQEKMNYYTYDDRLHLMVDLRVRELLRDQHELERDLEKRERDLEQRERDLEEREQELEERERELEQRERERDSKFRDSLPTPQPPPPPPPEKVEEDEEFVCVAMKELEV